MGNELHAAVAAALRDYAREGWWRGRTLFDYFSEAVRRTPEKIAVVAGTDRINYRDLDDQVNRVAANLARLGVGKGDILSLQLPNIAEFVVIHLAATKLGAVTNPLLPNYRSKELGYILGFARTKIAFICAHYRNCDYVAMYRDLRGALPDLKAVFVVGGGAHDGLRPFEELLAPAPPFAPTPCDGNEVTALMFTSGTESSPKGVMHSHNTMLYSTVEMARLVGLTADDVVWTPSPIGHATGFQWGVRQALTIGGTVALQDIWDAEAALRLIEAEHCSFVLSATPFVTMLLEAASAGRRDTSSLRIFGCAGAPIPRRLGERARAELGCTLIGMWGMTECFVGAASPPDDPDDRLWGSDGRAMPGVELAIFDSERRHAAPLGEVGELATRGPHLGLGYFNDPERTASTYRADGWLFSNDLAMMDAEGYIRIVGRMKDIINRGGLKISVREIEDMLIDHPDIDQVVLVPVPDERLGEKSCACIIPQPGRRPNLQSIVAFLTERGVAKYKMPEFVALMQEFPMTASGKIQRFSLKDDIVDGKIVRQTS